HRAGGFTPGEERHTHNNRRRKGCIFNTADPNCHHFQSALCLFIHNQMIQSLSKESANPKRKKTRRVSTLTPEQLARKRANDREAQRTIRIRTKEHIERLERELAELKSN
ncbi:uncharacterized protein B0J16DRAFT_49229, partial [Fusarium flagelliforme]|uniref:uncharacterized protein n=1 Tax=Fusarium flagelliforme TaxID=2675880 RepID=UPI001E8D31DD